MGAASLWLQRSQIAPILSLGYDRTATDTTNELKNDYYIITYILGYLLKQND